MRLDFAAAFRAGDFDGIDIRTVRRMPGKFIPPFYGAFFQLVLRRR